MLIAQKKIFFDQIDNKELFLDPNTKKPNFFRDMQKIKEHLKKEKNSDNKKKDSPQKEENYENFDEKNIIILESEEDKMSDDTKSNSIFINLFSEKYLENNDK